MQGNNNCDWNKKITKNFLIICLILFNFLLFLIIFIYIGEKTNMSQNSLNNLIYPILSAVVSSFITSVIVYMIFNYFSKIEKWRRLLNKINKKYPEYKNIDNYYVTKKEKNILQTNDGKMPIIDLFYIADFYINTIRRFGSVDEKDEIYNFMYKFLFYVLQQIKQLEKKKIKIQSGGKEEFTDVLFDFKFYEMFGKKIDRRFHLENYRNYILDLTFSEIKNYFYDSLVVYDFQGKKIKFLKLKLNKLQFKSLLKTLKNNLK